MTTQFRGFWMALRRELAPVPSVTPDQLRDPRPEIRWRAVRRLAKRRQLQHLPELFGLLADEDPIIRDEAVCTLASWGGEHCLSQARSQLNSRPSPILAASLLDLLARLPEPGNLEVLTPHLDAADPVVRAAAVAADGALGTAGDSGVLIPLLADPDARVRRAACAALGQIGDPAALEALAAAQHDPDPLVREAATRAVAGIEKAEAERRAKARRGQPSGGEPTSPEEAG